MIGPGSILSGFRCPSCTALQPARRIWRTSAHRGVFFPVESGTPCFGCGVTLRLSDQRKGLATGLAALVFVTSFLIGLALLRQFDAMTFVSPDGTEKANGLAFVLVMAFCVYPSVTLCNRVRRLEIVK